MYILDDFIIKKMPYKCKTWFKFLIFDAQADRKDSYILFY